MPHGFASPELLIPVPYLFGCSDGTNESRGSDQQAAESSQVVASLQPSRSQVSMQGPWKNEDAARNIEEPVPRANQISTGDWHGEGVR